MSKIFYFVLSVAAIVCAVIITCIFELKTRLEGGDERQIQEMLKSSSIGFYVLIVLSLVSFLIMRDFDLPFKKELLILFSVEFSFTVFLSREIWLDNLWSKYDKRLGYAILFALLLFVDIKFFRGYINNHHIENLLIPLVWSFCYLVCIVTFLIRVIFKRSAAKEDVE